MARAATGLEMGLRIARIAVDVVQVEPNALAPRRLERDLAATPGAPIALPDQRETTLSVPARAGAARSSRARTSTIPPASPPRRLMGSATGLTRLGVLRAAVDDAGLQRHVTLALIVVEPVRHDIARRQTGDEPVWPMISACTPGAAK